MRIKNCYISAFGKLTDFSVNFDEGLNVFKEENGWGKSTLTVFIKSMFYGLDDTRRSVAENERTKFKPWQNNGKFGGSVEFEWGGKNFRIERYFGAKASEDTVKLFDSATGKEYAKTEDLGKRIFEIDEEGFFSTTYFSQKDFSAKSNSSITAKFNSLTQAEDENAFETARKKIEEKAKKYKYRGDKGIITDLKRERVELETKIRQTEMAEQTAKRLKIEVKEAEETAENLKKEISKLSDRITAVGKAEALSIKQNLFKNALKEKEILEEKIAECNGVLNGNILSADELNAFSGCLADYNDTIMRGQAVEAGVRMLKETAQTQNKRKRPLAFLTAILFSSIACLGVGVGLTFVNLIVGIILLAVGLAGVATYFITRFTAQKEGDDLQCTERLSLEEAKLKGLMEIRLGYEKTIGEFLSKFNAVGSDFSIAFAVVKETTNEYKTASARLKEVTARINEYSTDLAVADISSMQNYESADEIKAKQTALQSRYDTLVNDVAKKRASIDYYEDLASTLPDLESKLFETKSKITDSENEYKILSYVLEYLDKADENLKVKYRSPLEEGFNKYLYKLTNGKLDKARIDVDLNVTLSENGESKVTDYYSKGYQNLFEICKRFALIDVLFTNEKPFIILDDPFTNLDDEKLTQALEFIKTLAKEYQILYFVCHESRKA